MVAYSWESIFKTKNSMTKKITITVFVFLCVMTKTFGQQNETKPKKWGIETNLVWPFFPGINIWQVKFTPIISQRTKTSTELIIGAFYRNTKDDPNAMVHKEIGGTVGLRHFFYKGFHVEVVSHITSATEEKNKLDGKDYTGLAITPELYAGCRFEFKKQSKVTYYLTPQLGFGKNILAQIGPETEKSSVFPILSLLVGFRF
jgi:hypothetical protein